MQGTGGGSALNVGRCISAAAFSTGICGCFTSIIRHRRIALLRSRGQRDGGEEGRAQKKAGHFQCDGFHG